MASHQDRIMSIRIGFDGRPELPVSNELLKQLHIVRQMVQIDERLRHMTRLIIHPA